MGSVLRVLLAAFAFAATLGSLPSSHAAGDLLGGAGAPRSYLARHAPSRHITRRLPLLSATQSRDLVGPPTCLPTRCHQEFCYSLMGFEVQCLYVFVALSSRSGDTDSNLSVQTGPLLIAAGRPAGEGFWGTATRKLKTNGFVPRHCSLNPQHSPGHETQTQIQTPVS